MAAIQNGRSVDTTMGLTPLEGLPGATRSGSIDPSLVFHYTSEASSLARSSTKELHISIAEEILNKQAGWYSMIGTTDFGKVVQGMHDGDEKMKLVFDLFVDRVVGYVGNYFVKLGGKVDALTFSGGIGEKSGDLRKAVIEKVACLGFKLDASGSTNSDETVVRLGPSVLLIKTNEEVSCGSASFDRDLADGLFFSVSLRWQRNVHKINDFGSKCTTNALESCDELPNSFSVGTRCLQRTRARQPRLRCWRWFCHLTIQIRWIRVQMVSCQE